MKGGQKHGKVCTFMAFLKGGLSHSPQPQFAFLSNPHVAFVPFFGGGYDKPFPVMLGSKMKTISKCLELKSLIEVNLYYSVLQQGLCAIALLLSWFFICSLFVFYFYLLINYLIN